MTTQDRPDDTPENTPDGPRGGQEEAVLGEEEKDEVTLLKEQLEEALREKDQFRTMAQRAQADLINYRRRAAEEVQEARRAAKAEVLLKFLAIVDDLDRALALVPPEAIAPGWLEGLQLVRRNMEHLLASEGVSRIEAEGRPFEPWEHEAVQYEETSDGPEGTVLRVLRQGYKLGDRVLRAAQVVVAKAPDHQGYQDHSTQEEA